MLKNIVDSPISIYVRGNKEILNNIGIAIIGCREATEYGIKVAKKIAYELAKEKIESDLCGETKKLAYILLEYLEEEKEKILNEIRNNKK